MDDATIIYICATCFRAEMTQLILQKVIELASKRQKPVTLVTVSKNFQAHSRRPRYSWTIDEAADKVYYHSSDLYKEIFPSKAIELKVKTSYAEQKVPHGHLDSRVFASQISIH